MRPSRHGLIGYPLGHSLSPFIHESLMASAAISGSYRLFELEPAKLATSVQRLMAELDGFNVTIPYKEAITPFLEGLDRSAADFGAVNTVYQKRGFNTDRTGFLKQGLALAGQRVLVIGAGGASRMLAFESVKAGADVFIASRTLEKTERLAQELSAKAIALTDLEHEVFTGAFDVILNGSPSGMWPNTGEQPIPTRWLEGCHTVFDTIYNPPATRLLLQASSIRPASLKDNSPSQSLAATTRPAAINGLSMLFEQALDAQQIWHPEAVFPKADQETILRQLPRRLLAQFPTRIVLNGFMGSGKTTVGQILAERLAIPFFDLDTEITRKAGKSIPEIFALEGEGWFRQLEHRLLQEVLDRSQSLVLAVGGGAMITPEALEAARKHPTQIVYLHVPLPELATRLADGHGRPMLQGDVLERIETLYDKRFPQYLAYADLTVDGSGEAESVAIDLAHKLGYETSEEF